ncbi:copper resistance protein B [Sphingobium sp.]|uniref:copper resistance protein B n=1 Tax=Sphingobium sp. TaxID=1912891 RepID=UPI0028BE5889|nr:copper resistance protein B [Sphingobium sp.]
MRALSGLLFCVCALLAGGPALARDDDAASLSGGFDLVELRTGREGDAFLWDGTFSYGDSTDQAMLVLQGGGALGGQIDEVQARLFYGRTISGNTVLLAGVRKDFKPHPRDAHAALGILGQIGSRLNWETYAFLSDKGNLTGEGQVIYALPITRRLYLEPRVAVGWSAQGIDMEAVRPGFTEGEATVRLRYRLTDRINAYAGVVHERLLGDTRALARSQGEAVKSTMAVIGFGFSL